MSKAQAELPGGVSAFEVMWPGYYEFVLANMKRLRRPLQERHAFYVLLECVGANPSRHAESFEEFLGAMIEDGTVGDAALARSSSDAMAFWAVRDAPGEYSVVIPNHSAYDISFSIADAGIAAQRCEDALRSKWPNAIVLTYGHLGDGNIHIVVDVPRSHGDMHEEIDDVIYQVTAAMNGSISAEHGIGTKKRARFVQTSLAGDINVMRLIKEALDPRNILNPGRIF
jgi:FAD/FMN-containing dehydrogenase